MKFRSLSTKQQIAQQPVLVRVDWNIPLNDSLGAERHLKLQRSKTLISQLVDRQAKPIFLTHIGRPKKQEKRFSTEHLLPIIKKAIGIKMVFLEGSVTKVKDLKAMQAAVASAEPGTCFLLENVRFEKGEETNDKALAKAYASLAKIFINDAFAACHRKHSSVAGIAAYTEAFAGPALIEEVSHLSKLLKKVSSPYLAILGGKKLSTKISLVKALLKKADRVFIGGAMATPFLRAQGYLVGASYCEEETIAMAKKLLKEKRIILPLDVMVTKKLSSHPTLRRVDVTAIEKGDIILDLGPKTLRLLHGEIEKTKTIVWNGPLGMTEINVTGFGSRFVAKSIGKHSDKSFTVCGGGDTIPVIAQTQTLAKMDFVSTGGGAMLEFLSNNGDLPGLKQLR